MLNIKEKQIVIDFMNMEQGFVNQHLAQRDKHTMNGCPTLAEVEQNRANSCCTKMRGIIDLFDSMGYKFIYNDDWDSYGIRTLKDLVEKPGKN